MQREEGSKRFSFRIGFRRLEIGTFFLPSFPGVFSSFPVFSPSSHAYYWISSGILKSARFLSPLFPAFYPFSPVFSPFFPCILLDFRRLEIGTVKCRFEFRTGLAFPFSELGIRELILRLIVSRVVCLSYLMFIFLFVYLWVCVSHIHIFRYDYVSRCFFWRFFFYFFTSVCIFLFYY